MKENRSWYRLIGSVIFLLVTTNAASVVVQAQEPLNWTPQKRIPGYDAEARTPYLVTDQNQTVHAFNSVWIEDQLVIVYSQWTYEDGWREPVDILLPQLKRQARIKGTFLDEDSNVHLVFYSGDELDANIYYARAPLSQAGAAPAWSVPEIVGQQPVAPDEANLIGNSQNHLFVLYSGQVEGRGLYATYSLDGGISWSEPIPVFLTYSNDLWPLNLKMHIDKQERIHAVWAVANTTGNSETIYYAQLAAGQTDWSEPVELASVTEFEVDTPSIITYEGELIVIYHDGFPTTRHMLRSRDGGQTWTPPVQLFPHVGSNGPASLVVDSNNTLHMFFGNRVGSHPARHALWHSVWQGARWSTPEPITPLEPSRAGYDPSFANAVVSQGNTILVTWMTDPGNSSGGTWYSYTTVNAPELPIRPLPTVPPTATPVVAPTLTVTPSLAIATPHSAIPISNTTRASTNPLLTNPATPLVVGITPIVLLILAVIVVNRIR